MFITLRTGGHQWQAGRLGQGWSIEQIANMVGALRERESLHQEKGGSRFATVQVLTTTVCGDVDGKGLDYLHLPCPVKYDELTREAYMSLKPELFEGVRFDITRPINNKFALSNSLFMGSVDALGTGVFGSVGPVVKQSRAHCELGANLVDQKGKMDIVMMLGRVLLEGQMSARVKYDVNDRFSIKADAQLTNEPHFTVGMFNFDYKGNDYRAQLTTGNNAYYGVNYMQSVTRKLSLGGEGIWLGRDRKSNMGLAACFKTDTVIATSLLKSEGQMSCTYVQKLSDKISIASDFVYNWKSGEAMTSIAYDYLIRQCRVRGRVDTNYCIAAYLEEKFSSGLTFLLSAELDHIRKDYKFGFGMTIGD